MFREMRAALQIPKTTDILTHIRTLSDTPDQPDDTSTSPDDTNNGESQGMSSPRSRAVATIQAIERRTMTTQIAQPGLTELMAYLTSHSLPKALCTRNFPAPVFHLLDKYLSHEKFHPIITRDTVGVNPKPSPEGLWECARVWMEQEASDGHDLEGARTSTPLEFLRSALGSTMIMVGDSFDDMAAGYHAGAATVLLVNDDNEALVQHEYTDLGIRRLDELIPILEEGFVGRDWEEVGMEGKREAEEYEVAKQ